MKSFEEYARVHLLGIEPKSTEPESVILSIELQVRGAMVFCPFGRVSLCKDTKIFIIRG